MCVSSFWYFIAISLIFCFVDSNFTTTDYVEIYNGESAKSESDYPEDTTTLQTLSDEHLFNLTELVKLKMATPCETPNYDPGYCIGIKKCTILYNQLSNTDAIEFLRESQCGPKNEDTSDPKVCCGMYGNYKNKLLSGSTAAVADDVEIFPKKCGTQKPIIKGRILGGKTAALGEFPWMARLVHKNKHGYKTYGCAGFLIHSKYVLTAAHCLHQNFTNIRGDLFQIVLGEHNSTTKIDCTPKGTFCAEPLQISRVQKVIIHDEYGTGAHYNDIALIHLKKGARITDYVRPICILTTEDEKPFKYILSGWGKTETEESSKVKLKVDLLSYDKDQCCEKYSLLNLELRDSQICAGGESNKDTCSGDSGGPLMMTTNGTTWFAAGIVSYGIGCGLQGWPGVYTNLPKYLPWIKARMIENSLSTRSGFFGKVKKHHKNKNNVKS